MCSKAQHTVFYSKINGIFMEIEDFCAFLKSVREPHLFRTQLAEKYPWHLNTIRSYETDRLCNVDYLAAISHETGYNFEELIKRHLEVGMLRDNDNLQDILALLFVTDTLNNNEQCDSSLEKVVAIDDSLDPTITSGAVMYVNTNIKTLQQGSIFCIDVSGVVIPRHVQFGLGDRVILSATNSKFNDLEVTRGELSESLVVGKVVKVLNDL